MTMSTASKEVQLQAIGKCAMGSIAEMVAALECDYDRLEELRDSRLAEDDISSDEWDELRELEAQAGDCESQEDAQQRIWEDPLSVTVRSPWYEPGKDPGPPEEFCILLSTGGPATRIIGELDEHGYPTRAMLQVQDWFTPWTECMGQDLDVVLTYASQFHYVCE